VTLRPRRLTAEVDAGPAGSIWCSGAKLPGVPDEGWGNGKLRLWNWSAPSAPDGPNRNVTSLDDQNPELLRTGLQ
jgi:hypothetical protein